MKERIRRMFAHVRQAICGWTLGHVWGDEKEFVSCKRIYCHKVTSKRELTARTLKGKRS